MFEWDTALVVEDDRYDYGETRLRAFGFIRGRLHVMVFTPRGARCSHHQPQKGEGQGSEMV